MVWKRKIYPSFFINWRNKRRIRTNWGQHKWNYSKTVKFWTKLTTVHKIWSTHNQSSSNKRIDYPIQKYCNWGRSDNISFFWGWSIMYSFNKKLYITSDTDLFDYIKSMSQTHLDLINNGKNIISYESLATIHMGLGQSTIVLLPPWAFFNCLIVHHYYYCKAIYVNSLTPLCARFANVCRHQQYPCQWSAFHVKFTDTNHGKNFPKF